MDRHAAARRPLLALTVSILVLEGVKSRGWLHGYETVHSGIDGGADWSRSVYCAR